MYVIERPTESRIKNWFARTKVLNNSGLLEFSTNLSNDISKDESERKVVKLILNPKTTK